MDSSPLKNKNIWWVSNLLKTTSHQEPPKNHEGFEDVPSIVVWVVPPPSNSGKCYNPGGDWHPGPGDNPNHCHSLPHVSKNTLFFLRCKFGATPRRAHLKRCFKVRTPDHHKVFGRPGVLISWLVHLPSPNLPPQSVLMIRAY